MRIARIALVAALALPASAAAGPELARCNGSAPRVTGVPSQPNLSFFVDCRESFTLPGATTITITLEPGPGFTGQLTGTIRSIPVDDAQNVKALYVGGQLVLGEASRSVRVRQGVWTFEVRAGGPPPEVRTDRPPAPCPPIPPPPGPVSCPGFAIGDFAGAVSTA